VAQRTTPEGKVSLARALSKLGYASRSEATKLVIAGRVTVDGAVARNPAWRIDPERAAIEVDEERIGRVDRVYLLLHKPKGVVTTLADPGKRPTVFDLLPPGTPYVSAVGRLDQDSEGLLLLTNDTAWANAIAAPDAHVEKVYRVWVEPPLEGEAARTLERGIPVGGRPTLPCRIRIAGSPGEVEVTLVEGRNRQVRRMMDGVGRTVTRLVRTAIGPLALGTLAPGEVRPLTPAEADALRTGSRAGTPDRPPARRP
jgi:23S rRNA pseudouridine2605 synthase